MEFAIILPLMLALFGGGVDLARLYFAQVSLTNAAKEAALQGASSPSCVTATGVGCADPNNIAWRATNEAGGGLQLSYQTRCDPTTSTCGPGSLLTVTLTAVFDPITPLAPSLPLSAAATARVLNPAIASGNVPVAAFTANPISGPAPLTVTFTDTSTGSPTSWNWAFGDGTSSSTQNPAPHDFAGPGPYLVSLTVANAFGSNAATTTISITSGTGGCPTGTVLVQSIVGLTKSQAENALVAAGLVVGTATAVSSTAQSPNRVVSQDPSANTSVCRGSTVNFTYRAPN